MRERTKAALVTRIQRALDERMGLSIWVDMVDRAIVLAGTVDSADDRDRAQEIAAELAPKRKIRNEVEVQQQRATPELKDAWRTSREELASEEPPESPDMRSLEDMEGGYPGDVPLETNDIDVVDDTVYDEEPAVEAEPAYFPPTDPVITGGEHGSIEVLGGFTPTSASSDEVEPSFEDERPGDEALADAVRRELREDAATTDLRIIVEVDEGVVRLRGQVPSVEDVVNVEAVAAQVPGVRDVAEELEVRGM